MGSEAGDGQTAGFLFGARSASKICRCSIAQARQRTILLLALRAAIRAEDALQNGSPSKAQGIVIFAEYGKQLIDVVARIVCRRGLRIACEDVPVRRVATSG